MTTLIDLTKSIKEQEPVIAFEPIQIQFDNEEDGESQLSGAETTLFNLLKLKELQVAAINFAEGIIAKEKNTRQMYNLFDAITEQADDCIYDVQDNIVKALDVEIARYRDYCERAQSELDDMGAERDNDFNFGTYEQQVRSILNNR